MSINYRVQDAGQEANLPTKKNGRAEKGIYRTDTLANRLECYVELSL